MSKTELAVYMEFARGLAHEAGVIMRRYFRAQDIGTQLKDDNTPLTIADTSINQMVIDRVNAAYPEHGIIGEEDSFEPERDYVWVVDPIDGTIPFSLGVPVSTFCLALVYKGEVQVSVVLEPFQDRLFSAMRGHGSYMNDQRLKVNPTEEFKGSYFLLSTWMVKGQLNLRDASFAIEAKGGKTLNVQSYAYTAAMVATGDIMVAGMSYGSPWDAAAISLIVQEAGGKVTDLKGQVRKFNEWGDGILITNGIVHEEIVALTKDAHVWN